MVEGWFQLGRRLEPGCMLVGWCQVGSRLVQGRSQAGTRLVVGWLVPILARWYYRSVGWLELGWQ